MTEEQKDKGMRIEIKVALIGLGGSLGAALIAGAVAIYTSGKKANETTGQPTTVGSNFRTGFGLADPSKPASASLPVQTIHNSPPATTPQRNPQPTPSIPAPVVIPPDVGTSSEVLDRCSGFEPLKPVRVKVELTSDGYAANIDLKNPTQEPIAVYSKWGGAPFTLTGGGEVLQTQSNIRDEGKFTLFHGFTPEVWDGAVANGLVVDPDGTIHISGQFHGKNRPPTAASATLSLTLLYFLKDPAGAKIMKNRSPECAAMPVTPSN